MSETRICPWTGQAFEVTRKGGSERVFASDTARAAAHKAARQYTLSLIDLGLMTWEELRKWAEQKDTHV